VDEAWVREGERESEKAGPVESEQGLKTALHLCKGLEHDDRELETIYT
jgi:hypothetical protein